MCVQLQDSTTATQCLDLVREWFIWRKTMCGNRKWLKWAVIWSQSWMMNLQPVQSGRGRCLGGHLWSLIQTGSGDHVDRVGGKEEGQRGEVTGGGKTHSERQSGREWKESKMTTILHRLKYQEKYLLCFQTYGYRSYSYRYVDTKSIIDYSLNSCGSRNTYKPFHSYWSLGLWSSDTTFTQKWTCKVVFVKPKTSLEVQKLNSSDPERTGHHPPQVSVSTSSGFPRRTPLLDLRGGYFKVFCDA